jgi:hypothetical protein
MTRIKRAEWIIRLSLVALLLVFFAAIVLFYSNTKLGVSPSAARELVAQWQHRGSQRGEELESVLGPPHKVQQTSKGKRISWLFEESSLQNLPLYGIMAEINQEDHVYGMAIGDVIYGDFWEYHWDRLKRRFGFD